MFKIGLDIGGTKIEGIVLDGQSQEIFRRRLPTEARSGYDHIISQISAVYFSLVEHISSQPHSLGIATPGSISRHTNRLKNCNVLELNGRELHHDIKKRLSREFVIENDANCFALAEAMRGVGRNYKSMIGVVVGTGCGAGIVIDGRLHSGRSNLAGEIGHQVIDTNGPDCYCGRRGCLERYVCGPSLEQRYCDATSDRVSLEEIVLRSSHSDQSARVLITQFFDSLSIGLANMIAIIDPDLIVLGGGVSNIPNIAIELQTRLEKIVFNDRLETCVRLNSLGDSAGVIGAAELGMV